jgi:hypothetical protein
VPGIRFSPRPPAGFSALPENSRKPVERPPAPLKHIPLRCRRLSFLRGGVRVLLGSGPMTNSSEHAEWLRLIQAEYREIPGLKLTKPQAQRLWGLEGHICEVLLDALIASRFLCKTPAQAYVLADQR